MNDQRSFSLADRVFETLEQNILEGVYPPGEILTETALSQQLGVSRTPIREAIRRLQQENMVRSCGKGIQILGIDLQDLSDIYEIRTRIDAIDDDIVRLFSMPPIIMTSISWWKASCMT